MLAGISPGFLLGCGAVKLDLLHALLLVEQGLCDTLRMAAGETPAPGGV